jgi:predicted nuclease of predicted toxin-antitoxin system
MRFLTDQDVYAVTVKLLRELQHDVVTAAELGLSRASDIDLIQTAIRDRRVFVTRDRDFGGLIFVNAVRGGVFYIRAIPATLNLVHDELVRVLELYSEQELLDALVVVEPARHRMRRNTS